MRTKEAADSVTLTYRELATLIREAAETTERAFRRGFQQGHLAAQGKLCGGNVPTDEQISDWRFKFDSIRNRKKKKCDYPPGSWFKGGSDSLIGRMAMETNMDQEVLCRFLHEVDRD